MKDKCYWEEWDFNDWKSLEDSEIMFGYLLRESEDSDFKLLSGSELYNGTVEFITGVRGCIAHELVNDQHRSRGLGIYVNQNRINNQEVQNFNLPLQEKLISGLALRMEWNDRLLFVETTKEYMYMYWGTSA